MSIPLANKKAEAVIVQITQLNKICINHYQCLGITINEFICPFCKSKFLIFLSSMYKIVKHSLFLRGKMPPLS